MSRWRRIALIVLAVFVVLVGGTIVFLESGLARGIVASAASAKLGRPVTIGSLPVGFIPHVRVEVRDLAIANIEGGSMPNMVEMPRIEAVLDFWKLVTGRLDVLLVTADTPLMVLEKDKDGNGNWKFGDPNKAATDTA